jgi:hypothetical protein
MNLIVKIRNYLNCRKIKKYIKNNPSDPVVELRKLMDVGFSQEQSLAILNAIVNMRERN